MRDLPRHFAADGDLISGATSSAALSAVFPDGEDYFVRSVRHYRDRISDPALKRQVAGFIGQEAVHGREHRVFNDRLAELGYPTKRYENVHAVGLRFRERTLLSPTSRIWRPPPRSSTSPPHWPSSSSPTRRSADLSRRTDAVRDLFVWHALEESEHKAVAFDVYRAVGGSERLRHLDDEYLPVRVRAVGMWLAVVISLLGDRATYRRGNLRRSWRRLKRSPIVDPALWVQLKDYNRPDFHPDDSDTTELVEAWRAELFGEHGTLNDKLIGAAA